MLEKVSLVCNRKAELLMLVGATFDFKVASSQKDDKEKSDNSEKIAEKILPLFVCHLLTFELSHIN